MALGHVREGAHDCHRAGDSDVQSQRYGSFGRESREPRGGDDDERSEEQSEQRPPRPRRPHLGHERDPEGEAQGEGGAARAGEQPDGDEARSEHHPVPSAHWQRRRDPGEHDGNE